MDRIKKALDKSKTVRGRRGLRHFDGMYRGVENHPLENLEYTQTRKLPVSPSVLADNRLIAGIKSDPRAAAFRMLRTQVLHTMRENRWTSLAVTGPISGIGKSLVAANLAISISLEVNQTVLLVDLDLRRPAIHKYFNISPNYGILDYITSNIAIEKIFINPTYERLVILPGKGSTSDSSEILSSPKMIDLVKDLKSRYQTRIVIFDLPPLLHVDDALVFLPNVESTLLVVENGKNTVSEVEESMRLLDGSNLIGTVLNKAEEETREYY